MFASLFLFIRLLAAWLFAYLVIVISGYKLLFGDDGREPEGLFVFGMFALVVAVASTAFSHIRRVRLVAGEPGRGSLSSRHRRRIEIPFDAAEAFEMVDAAIRELPGASDVESARDSLQVRARVSHADPYEARRGGRAGRARRNLVLANVTPSDGAGSVMLVCEPARPAWTDLFFVDGGTNLENAESVVRALARRVAERRRGERQAMAQGEVDKELMSARLNLLQAQVEPHFLYNTLANAQLLVRNDPPRADEMLGNLITYLRRSLPSATESMSTLGDELERVRAYLDILAIRMGTRLKVSIEVPPALHRLPLPPMMLQTLVENAIKHGLEPKPGGGTVWILARAMDGKVAVTVADDGCGFGETAGGSGIGLANLRERLRLMYGDTASFAIGSNFPSGVAATISVPDTRAAQEMPCLAA